MAYSDWSLQLGQLGSVVEDVEDVHQSIRIILGTPKGSDPQNPEFGSDLWKYLDMPTAAAAPHLVRETAAPVLRWEPRVKRCRVSIQTTGLSSRALRIVWTGQDRAGETIVDLPRSDNGASL